MFNEKVLNETGRSLIELKYELQKLEPKMRELVLSNNKYKKYLLNDNLSEDDFEKILKNHDEFLLTKKELKELYVSDFFSSLEDNLEGIKFDGTVIGDTVQIYIYLGMSRQQYSNYMNVDINDIRMPKGVIISDFTKNKIAKELEFAKEVANKRVKVVGNKILASLQDSIDIPKNKSKFIKLNFRTFENGDRFLKDSKISLSFPIEYIDIYSKTEKIATTFIKETWKLVDLYKTW